MRRWLSGSWAAAGCVARSASAGGASVLSGAGAGASAGEADGLVATPEACAAVFSGAASKPVIRDGASSSSKTRATWLRASFSRASNSLALMPSMAAMAACWAASSDSQWVWASSWYCSACSVRRSRRQADSSCSTSDSSSSRRRASRCRAFGVLRSRRDGSCPPRTIWNIWAQNSISRMPPRPSFTSKPALSLRARRLSVLPASVRIMSCSLASAVNAGKSR